MNVLLWTVPVLVACAGVSASGVLRSADWTAAAVFLLVAIAAETCARARAGTRGSALARWPMASLTSALVMACSAPVLLSLGQRTRELVPLAPLVHALLRILGFDVALAEGRIHSRENPLLAYSIDWAKLGLLPAIWIGLGCVVLVALYSKRAPMRALLAVLVVLSTYTLARFATLTALTLPFSGAVLDFAGLSFTVDAFVHPLAQALSLLPLSLFLARWVPWDRLEVAVRPGRPATRATLVAGASLALLAGFAAVWALGVERSGPRRAGRVVIDELHSRDWSSSLAPLDTESFGRSTVYNYTLLVRFLGQYFDVRVNDDAPYGDATLADVDVLVLKTATSPFAAAEIEAIERFVRRGGGLFVIGDHTDLLGMSTNLNAVASRFEMRFQPDACNRLEDGQAHSWTPLPWEMHPITAGLERLDFMTSCTLDVPSDAQRLLVVRNTFSDALDYSSPSFFGDVAPDMDDPLGVHLVAAAREIDQGRVVLFGDSTVFSSFGLTLGGRAEFLLRTVDWLDRSSAPSRFESVAALTIAALSLAALLRVLRGIGARSWLGLALPAALAGAGLGVVACASRNAGAHPVPEAQRPLPVISIVEDDCDFALPTPLLADETVEPERAYDVFYTWTQRVGALPLVEALPQALERPVAVLIRPRAALLERAGQELREFVRRGGSLMVLCETNGAIRDFARGLGVSLESSSTGSAPLVKDEHGRPVPTFGALSATTVVEVGDGRLALVSEPDAFSRIGLGKQLEQIGEDDPRRELFAELFGAVLWLLRGPSQPVVPVEIRDHK